jgi:hypothetical protein
LASLLLGAIPGAQTTGAAQLEGDTIIGLGSVANVGTTVINDQAMWVTLTDTDYPDLDRDEALVRNGFVTLREGSNLFSPPGANLDTFKSFWLTDNGDLAIIADVDGVPTANNSLLLWNTIPLAQKALAFDTPDVPAGTTWSLFDTVKINDSNTVVVLGEIRRPGSTRGEDVLARYQLDSLGNVLSTNVLAVKDQFIPVLSDLVKSLGNTEHAVALNKHGDFITFVDTVASDAAAYLINMDTILALEGSPSPIPGRTWVQLTLLPKMDLNDFGEYAFTASVTADTGNQYVVVKNGEILAKEGDILPPLAPFPLGKGSSAPIYIANSGDVFWWAQGVGTNNDVLLRNFDAVVQQGRTTVNGALVTRIESGESAFHVSPDGRFFIAQVELQVLGSALVLVDFGVVVPIPGCLENPGELALLDGRPLPGSNFRLTMDSGQAVGVQPVLMFSSRQSIPGSDCGIPLSVGELLINPAARVGLAFGPLWSGSPSIINVNLPPNLALVDMTVYAQGYFWDVGDQSPAENFRLTNALRIEVGAP